MIATYLVHHGYCATAEAFARSTGQEFGEEVASIKNRQSKFIYLFITSENACCTKSRYLDILNLSDYFQFGF